MGKYDRIAAPEASDEFVGPLPPDAAPARSKYDRGLPEPRKEQGWGEYLAQGTGDFFEGVGHYGSFGMLPRMDAVGDVITGRKPSYDEALAARLKRREAISERSPVASTVGGIAGGVGTGIAGGATKLGANIAGRLGAGPLARFAGFGTEAATVGGLQGAGNTYSGDPADYAKNAGKGAAVGGLIGGAAGAALVPASAVRMRAGNPATGQPIRQPSEQELRALSDRGYQVLRGIPVTYPGNHLQGTLSQAESQMITQGVAPEQARTVFQILERMRNHPGSISPAQVDGFRQSLNNMKNMPTVGSEKAGVAAAILRDTLDDMIQQGAGAASNPQLGAQAAQVVARARGDRAAMFRSQQLTDPAANAAAKAQAGGPPVGEQLVPKGLKLGERKRGEYPNQRGWIPEERARLAAAITPTLPERVAKFGADYFGRDIPALAGGKFLSDRLRGSAASGIERRWEDAAAAMRGRSPAYARATRNAVPVTGPGMGAGTAGTVGAGTGVLGTPYTDEREALAWSALHQMMP